MSKGCTWDVHVWDQWKDRYFAVNWPRLPFLVQERRCTRCGEAELKQVRIKASG